MLSPLAAGLATITIANIAAMPILRVNNPLAIFQRYKEAREA